MANSGSCRADLFYFLQWQEYHISINLGTRVRQKVGKVGSCLKCALLGGSAKQKKGKCL